MAEILEEDKREIGKLVQQAKKTNNPEFSLQAAIKAKDYADLVYEAFEKLTGEFTKYKDIAGKHYYKYAKASDYDYAYSMAMLVYLQGGNKKKAKKALKKLNKRSNNQRIDPAVLEILVDVLNDDFLKVKRKLKKNKYDIDDNIEPDIEKLLKYEEARS